MSREHSPELAGIHLTQVRSVFSSGGCKVSVTSWLNQVLLSNGHRHSVSKGTDCAKRFIWHAKICIPINFYMSWNTLILTFWKKHLKTENILSFRAVQTPAQAGAVHTWFTGSGLRCCLEFILVTKMIASLLFEEKGMKTQCKLWYSVIVVDFYFPLCLFLGFPIFLSCVKRNHFIISKSKLWKLCKPRTSKSL